MLSQRSEILPPPLNLEPAVVEREWPRVLDPVELARRLPRRPRPLSHPFGPVAPRELVLYGHVIHHGVGRSAERYNYSVTSHGERGWGDGKDVKLPRPTLVLGPIY